MNRSSSKNQRPPRVSEPLLAPNDGKGLTREPCEQQVKMGDGFGVQPDYVSHRTQTEVVFVGFARLLVDVAGENNLKAQVFRGDMEAADAAEEVSAGYRG